MASASCGPVELVGSEGGTDAGPAWVGPSVPMGCVAGGPSAQFKEQSAPPAMMRPGERAQVSVTFVNCSESAWQAGQVALTTPPGRTSPWGIASVALPRDVAYGEEIRVPFEVRAPNEPGEYLFAWMVSRGASERYQEPSTTVRVTVNSPTDCSETGPVARFRRQTTPAAYVGLGERVRGTVTFANCGADTWTRGSNWALESALDDRRTHIQVSRVELPMDVAFGQEVTIAYEGTAPDALGTYPISWGITREGARVGDASPTHTITVNRRFDCPMGAPPAKFVSLSAPDEMDPGAGADVGLTYANCGTAVWNRNVRIQPATGVNWGAANIPLPIEVAPGFQASVGFRITAPRDGGSHAFRWAVHDGGALNEPTPERSIRVRFGPGPCGVRPSGGGVTSPFGWRVHPIYGDRRLHTGMDFGAGYGTPIRACRDGVVRSAGWGGGYGNLIVLDHGGGMTTYYAHQSRFAGHIRPGVFVPGGDTIGFIGSTGNSTGAHLHFEVRLQGNPVNPAPYIP